MHNLLTKDQLQTVVAETKKVYTDYPELRYGQAFWNTLYGHRPDLANLLLRTESDPHQYREEPPYCHRVTQAIRYLGDEEANVWWDDFLKQPFNIIHEAQGDC